MPASLAEVQAFRYCLDVNDSPDFTIRVDQHLWHVHSDVFSQQSAFFDKLCNGSFKEAIEDSVTLHEDCPWIVARMIQFVYFGIYDHKQHERQDDDDPQYRRTTIINCMPSLAKLMEGGWAGEGYEGLKTIDFNRSGAEIAALVYRLADKYDIPTLRVYAVTDLRDTNFDTEDHFFTVSDIIGMPSLHMETDLLRYMLGEISSRFAADHAGFPRLRQLLQHDFKAMMILLGCLHKSCEEAKRALARCAAAVSAKNSKIDDLKEEIQVKDRALASIW